MLIAVFASAGMTDVLLGTEWPYYRARYDTLGVSDTTGMVIRLGLITVGTLAALAFPALVPRRAGWYASAGRWTLVGYLFHGFLVKGIGYTSSRTGPTPTASPRWRSPLIGIAAALLLSWNPLVRRLILVVDPYGRDVETDHEERQQPDDPGRSSVSPAYAPPTTLIAIEAGIAAGRRLRTGVASRQKNCAARYHSGRWGSAYRSSNRSSPPGSGTARRATRTSRRARPPW